MVALAVEVVAPLAAPTAGSVVEGIVFSAVGLVAGFLSAPGTTDRGLICTLAAAVSCLGAAPPPLQRFVIAPPATANSAKKPASTAVRAPRARFCARIRPVA
jgi:hypothetical protein